MIAARLIDNPVRTATGATIRQSVGLRAAGAPDPLELASVAFGLDSIRLEPLSDRFRRSTVANADWRDLVQFGSDDRPNLFSVVVDRGRRMTEQ